MYKVFVNESPLILTNERPDNSQGNVFTLDDNAINYAVTSLAKNFMENQT